MARLRPLLALLPALLAPASARADAAWLEAARAERWAEAGTLAARHPDPVVSSLVEYYRLLTPGAARAPEIAAFLTDNAGWPSQAQLARRLSDTMLAERDEQGVVAWCRARAQQPALPPCPAGVLSLLRAGTAVDAARTAWVRGVEPAAEAAFVRLWGASLTADDQWRRFDRLVAADTGLPNSPAARQAARVEPARQKAAEARLALRRDDPAPAMAQLVAQPDPSVVLDLVRWHRRFNRDMEAAQVWVSHGAAAEAAAADRRAFWDERNLLTRRMLRLGNPPVAYALASSHAQTGESALDAEFLAGWIALRRLGDPSGATRHFQALAGASKSAITQGRAQYWLGRAAAAQDQPEAAADAYRLAAAWPLTYYGQHAARALGDDGPALAARIAAVSDPAYDPVHATDWTARDLARAAVLLAAAGDPRRARAFLLRLDESAEAPGHTVLARLANGLGLPDVAVAVARRAGREGVVLGEAGWPQPVSPPGVVERAVALALIRQESSFDVQAASPVGARGLMQLMPATAAAVAKRLQEPADVGALTRDAGYNMRLGTAYLQSLLTQFGGTLPFALAGYNAGPSRVTEWLAQYGDPRTGALDMIDWIELIPFTETRNYVQRVLEGVETYRAHPSAPMQVAGAN